MKRKKGYIYQRNDETGGMIRSRLVESAYSEAIYPREFQVCPLFRRITSVRCNIVLKPIASSSRGHSSDVISSGPRTQDVPRSPGCGPGFVTS